MFVFCGCYICYQSPFDLTKDHSHIWYLYWETYSFVFSCIGLYVRFRVSFSYTLCCFWFWCVRKPKFAKLYSRRNVFLAYSSQTCANSVVVIFLTSMYIRIRLQLQSFCVCYSYLTIKRNSRKIDRILFYFPGITANQTAMISPTGKTRVYR